MKRREKLLWQVSFENILTQTFAPLLTLYSIPSGKEAEVLAMENGGNKKVNAIWEANLQRAGGRKPVTGADLNTRERYIRDKYERRRFYDPQALIDYQNNEPSFADIGSKNQGGDFANFGPPPEAQVSGFRSLRVCGSATNAASG